MVHRRSIERLGSDGERIAGENVLIEAKEMPTKFKQSRSD